MQGAPGDISPAVDESTLLSLARHRLDGSRGGHVPGPLLRDRPVRPLHAPRLGSSDERDDGVGYSWSHPSLITFVVIYSLSARKSDPVALVFLVLWVAHYLHRSFIYPFRLHSSRPSITVSVIAMGAAFNVGQRLSQRPLSVLAGARTADLVAARPPVRRGSAPLLVRLHPQSALRPSAHRPAQGRGERLQDPPRRRIPVCLLPQLPGRDGGVGRLGARLLESWEPWPSSSGPWPTWLPGPSRPTTGTRPSSPTIRSGARPFCRSSSDPGSRPCLQRALEWPLQRRHTDGGAENQVRRHEPSKGDGSVARSVFWLMISLLAWELFQGLRGRRPSPRGSWALTPLDLVFLVAVARPERLRLHHVFSWW